jgi:hypothetical protein
MNNNKYILCLIIAFLGVYTEGSFAQVAVNTDGSAADTKAMLDVKSTDKGLLIPRMTTAQRTGIATPVPDGLLVYDITTHSVWQYNSITTAWVEINGSGSTIWKVRNTDTVYTTNKQVGINNSYPQAPLHVMGGGFIIQGKQKLPFNAAANTYTLNASGTNSNASPTPDSMGIIKSHSSAGTSPYGGGTNATMTVVPKSGTSPIGVRLTFTHFNTEATNDTVVIKDYNNDHDRNIVFSGATLPAVFDYSSQTIYAGFRVKFQENNSTTLGTGFILKYEFIYPDNNTTVIEKTVGNGLMYDVTKNALVLGDLGGKKSDIGLGSTSMGNATASGNYSLASGYNSTASGIYSLASGYNSTASGFNSTALGGGSASGNNSTALGGGLASGYYSTALSGIASGWTSIALGGTAAGYGSMTMGNTTSNVSNCTTIGLYNNPIVTTPQTTSTWITTDPLFIIGNGSTSTLLSNALVVLKNGDLKISGNLSSGTSTASGYLSTAMGVSTASGTGAVAMGDQAKAHGNQSTAFGYQTTAVGSGSMATGSVTVATGSAATSMGYGTSARAFISVAIGQFNDSIIGSSTTSWVGADPVFTIGNGSSNASRSNSLIIYKNGNGIMYGTLTQTSDRRQKRDITPLSNALDKVLKINGMNYYWKDTTTHDSRLQAGVIAQEVQAVMPELVNTDHKGMLSVNYQGITPYLIESIKTLKKENDDLKQQIATLHLQEKRIADLEKQAADFNALKADMATLKAALQTAVGQKGDPSVKTASTERK